MKKTQELSIRHIQHRKSGIKVFELMNALQFMPPDATIEICVSQYNKAYPHYIYLETRNGESAEHNPNMEGVVRLFSSLPQTETEYTILSTRNK